MESSDFEMVAGFLKCPQTSEPLAIKTGSLVNKSGSVSYPILNGIPWLLPFPGAGLAEWDSRISQYQGFMNSEITDLKRLLAGKTLLKSSRARLSAWLDGRTRHYQAFLNLMSCFSGSFSPERLSLSEALWGKQPAQQQLMSYDQTIFRDWAWGADENKRTLALIGKILPRDYQLGTCLFIGAGACGLPVDIHNAYQGSLSIACDINPWLFFVANKILAGEQIELIEFPHPLEVGESPCINHQLKLSRPVAGVFTQLFSDILKHPFESEWADTICTPWFIDIIQKHPLELFRIFNSLVKPGGSWINFGPLLFDHCGVNERFTIEEVIHLAAKAGFEITEYQYEHIPYLKSPHSSHFRTETIFAFKAKKIKSIDYDLKMQSHLPEWITDPTLSIPRKEFFHQFQNTHQVYCDIVKEIDGKLCLEDLAEVLGRKFNMKSEQMMPSLVNFLSLLATEEKSFLFRGLS